MLSGYKVLMRPMWGWGFETGSHALRLVVSGHFDRFPRSKLMLGHLGETLPFLLWRFDSRAEFHGLKLKKPPSEYIRENIFVTTSGMCSAEPLDLHAQRARTDRVMFAADYPFEHGRRGRRTSSIVSRSTRRCATTSAATMRRACSG